MPGLALIFACCLALIHLGASRLPLATAEPRSRWLSLAGGTSVAYVFVHIMPELKRNQDVMVRADLPVQFLEHHAYIVALLGFITFYGLDRLAVRSRRQSLAVRGKDATTPMVFWIHIVSFACFNALVGYLLLHREQPGTLSLSFFFIAMGAHFLVNDYGLRQHHKEPYNRIGCWLLAGSVLVVTASAFWPRSTNSCWPYCSPSSPAGSSSTSLKKSCRKNRRVSFGPLPWARRSTPRCC